MPTDHVEGVHVLLGTVAMQGHMNPMLKFAKCLASKGVHVTVATTDVARHRLLKQKNSDGSAGTEDTNSGNPKIQLEFYSDGLSLEFDRNSHLGSFIDSLLITGYKSLSNLIASVNRARKISCLVFNPFMPWMADVAADHGIPCAALWIQASAIYSVYYRYFDNPNLFGNLENPNGDQVLIELPGMPALEVKDLPTLILPSAPAPIKSQVVQFYQNLNKVNWVLGASFYELEEKIVDSMSSLFPIHPIGPLVSPFLLGKQEEEEETANNSLKIDLFNAEDSCIDWLDKQRPRSVVYIAFGSLIALTQSHVDSIASALKSSSRPFLWVLKQSEKGSECKTGRLPSGFLEETKEKGVVVEWCAQEKVLMHESLACFVTHGGWNSTLETVVSGVPVVAYPMWTDQPTNARLIADVFKVGVSVGKGGDGVASGEEVERCIVEVTDGPRAEEIKKRALELKEAAKKAVLSGGSSDNNIDWFIREISAQRV